MSHGPARGPTDAELLGVMVWNQRRSEGVERQLDGVRGDAARALAESDALIADLGHLIEGSPPGSVPPSSPLPAPPRPAELPAWGELVAQAQRAVGPAVSYRDLLSPAELREVNSALATFEAEQRAARAMDGWDMAAASVSGLIAGVLDLVLVGEGTLAIGAKLASLLGCPTEHVMGSPKVSFDHVLSAEHGARGNHRWNSASHHASPGGLIAAVRDVMAGTSTHIVDGRVVIVNCGAPGVAAARADTALGDPGAGLLRRLLAAIGIVLRHWQSDANTPLGLPGPWMLLAKLLNTGSVPDGDGGHLTIAELAGRLYAGGMDLRRFVGDGITVLVNEVFVRLWCFGRRLYAGGTIRAALDAANAATTRARKMLLTAHLLTAGCNAGTVILSSNPLAVNLTQWTATLTYLARYAKWALFDAAEELDAAHRARWTQLIRAELEGLSAIEGRLRGVQPIVIAAA